MEIPTSSESRPEELSVFTALCEEFLALHDDIPTVSADARPDVRLRQFYELLHAQYKPAHEDLPAPPGTDELTWINGRQLGRFYKFLHERARSEISAALSADVAPAGSAQHGAAAHANPAAGRYERAALCLSGGGIRSATFNLGVLQSLASLGLLQKVEYLSTVSGGGYIGSWLSAWIHRDGGVDQVAQKLVETPPSPLTPEAKPITHLRNYSNYLAPRLGAASADTWTLASVYFRNLILNWSVLVPLMAAVLALPRIVLGAEVSTFSDYHGWMSPLLGGIAALLALAALAYRGNYEPSSRPPEDDKANTNRQFVVWFVVPLTLSAWLFAWAWAAAGDAIGVVAGIWWVPIALCVVLNLVGWLLNARQFLRGGRTLLLAFQGIILAGAVSGFCLWLIVNEIFPHPYAHPVLYACLGTPAFLASFLLGSIAWAGYTSRISRNADLEWWAREGAWVLMVAVVWIVISLIVLFGPAAVLAGPLRHAIAALLLPLSGIASSMLGKSASTPANNDQANKLGFRASVPQYALSLAAPLFVITLAIFISILTDSLLYLVFNIGSAKFPTNQWQHYDVLHAAGFVNVFITAFSLLILALITGHYVDANKFSLSQTYRNRLVRAYLGASNIDHDKNCDQFTGFDEADNLAMYKLRHLHSPAVAPGRALARRPFHVINIALNLVHGSKLSWQQRKAESFTVTPLHCGCHNLRYRRSETYPGGLDHVSTLVDRDAHRSAITLGTAMAISGAAASPNQGYHSSPLIGLIMTFFNVRLGAWLHNPAFFSKNRRETTIPRASIRPIVSEALGLTDDTSAHVYLSDGGHFENLGIYEMVLRRCRFILVSDAGADPNCTFEDLGNAIRKIRIDLGVPIDLSTTTILPRSKNKPGAYCAVGSIRYSCIDPGASQEVDGTIVYIKPVLYGDEPTDVYNYGQQYPDFPHQSTADQFFTESQFESYRSLGAFLLKRIWGRGPGDPPPRDFEEFAREAAALTVPLTLRLAPADGMNGGVFLTGNLFQAGMGKLNHAIPAPNGVVTLHLKPGEQLHYNWVLKDDAGVMNQEAAPVRSYKAGSAPATRNDTWQ